MNALRILGGMALASLLASNAIASGNVQIIAKGSSLHSALAFGNNPVIPFVGPPTSPTWLSLTTVVVSPTSNDLYVAGDNVSHSSRDHASVIYRIKR